MKRKGIGCAIFFSAIISGVLYCLYLQQNDMNFFKTIYNGLLTNYEQEINSGIVVKLFWDYIKKISIVFVLGSFSILLPLGFCMVFIIIFSYSFTISCFITLYGLKGALASLVLYGIQSILVIAGSFYILCYKGNYGEMIPKTERKPIYLLGMMIIGLGIVISCDLLGIVNFNFIKEIFL